ncbi:MAG: hypothetical protein OXG52_06270 [bacterium]|nr:hypothetical protein [bacterium]
MMIEDLTDAVAGYVWLQRSLAAALHSWRAREPDAEAAVFLHSTARTCEQHAAGWEALLADSPALAAPERVRPPSEPGADGLTPGAAGDAAGRLANLTNVVLPRLLASFEQFGARLSDVAEAPEKRFCAIVVGDLRAALERGRLLADRR